MAWPGARHTYQHAAAEHRVHRASSLADLQLVPPVGGIAGPAVELPAIPAFAGTFTRDTAISADAIGATQQTGYIPAFADADSAIGIAAVGLFAVGYLQPYHVKLEVELRSLDPGGPLYPVLVKVPR